ncbi:MAG TPA: response regulator transcription factor [Gaiellaceae bacterium]|nr:response regulator transcription factor [Gaiellaceae bacterium]
MAACGGRILVVEADAQFCAFLVSLIDDAGYEAFAVDNGEEALCAARADAPDVAVLAVELPGISGYEVCRRLRAARPAMGIVLVSESRNGSLDRATGLVIGADHYLVKPFAADELLASILALLRRVPISPAPSAATAPLRSDLTAREQEVLELLARGASQGEIAEDLVISPKTVAAHIDHILHKLQVHSRAQAVAVAYRDGYLAVQG